MFVYLGSAFVALLMTPVIIRIARRFRIAAIPGHRHMHETPTSHIGGVAIFVSMLCMTVPVLFLSNVIGEAFRGILPQVVVLLTASGFMFLVGLVDDLKSAGVKARVKLAAQFAASVAVCAAGIRIESVVVPGWFAVDFGWFSWPLTLIWLVGITNAVNLTDGLDGLAAGISAIACGVIAVFAVHSGNVVMAVLMLALLGSLTGFLFFNFNPAKIFMGDCGSMFLGFTIASSSVLCSTKSPVLVGLALPALALGIPIFDTLFAILRRFLERRSIFSADRGHFHHRLVDAGLDHRHAVIAIYVVTLIAAGLGMLMMVIQNGNSLIIFMGVLLFQLIVFRSVGYMRVKDLIGGLQRKYAISNREQEEVRRFEDSQLHFRRVLTFSQWWQAISAAAEKMDFLSIHLAITNRDGSHRTLSWQRRGKPRGRRDGLMKASIPLTDRRSGSSLNLRIEVCKNGSLESAGRRVALFSRLMDEHDIVTLRPDKTNSPSGSDSKINADKSQ